MIAAMLALLFSLFVHPAPAPAAPPHLGDIATSTAAGAVSEGLHSTPAPAAATVPTCAGGEEWDGDRCVALQLPEETTGRQYDPAD